MLRRWPMVRSAPRLRPALSAGYECDTRALLNPYSACAQRAPCICTVLLVHQDVTGQPYGVVQCIVDHATTMSENKLAHRAEHAVSVGHDDMQWRRSAPGGIALC